MARWHLVRFGSLAQMLLRSSGHLRLRRNPITTHVATGASAVQRRRSQAEHDTRPDDRRSHKALRTAPGRVRRKMPRGRNLKLTEDHHPRRNALTDEWVLVSPHRATRPWQGELAQLTTASEPAYDPTCYLCPGNTRSGGIRNH